MEHSVTRARKRSKITQAELARMTGLSPSVICRIEKGERGTIHTYRLIGRALGIDYRKLLPKDDAA